MSNRLDWDTYALMIARVASLRSEDLRKVGACALDFDNRVVAVAYNGLAPGKNVDPCFWQDRDARRPYMIHAEANLLSLVKRGEVRLVACTLLPCSSCATNIAAYGVKKVVYEEVYQRDTKSFEIFNFYGIELKQITLEKQ
jgi:dCMP deaminase